MKTSLLIRFCSFDLSSPILEKDNFIETLCIFLVLSNDCVFLLTLLALIYYFVNYFLNYLLFFFFLKKICRTPNHFA